MLARAALYFDEVARRGSIRRASERLHIAPSAVDRQIIQLEEQMGMPLFERLPQGLRLTAAGETLIVAVRRWKRDLESVKSQIDDLRGLRRGEVSVALNEGAAEFLAGALKTFQDQYPAIAYRFHIAGSLAIADLVLGGEYDIGLTFNTIQSHALRIEQTLLYRLGIVVRPDHPLAARGEVSLAECLQLPLIVPDETISLRTLFDQAWAKTVGGSPRIVAVSNSISMVKALVKAGVGLGVLTEFDVLSEIRDGEMVFLTLSDPHISISDLSVLTASGRLLSVPASLFLQHLAGAMLAEAPGLAVQA